MAAIRAARMGSWVAIVEANYWSGVCLNVGRIPSKALLCNAEIAHLLRTDTDTFGIEGATIMRTTLRSAIGRARGINLYVGADVRRTLGGGHSIEFE